MPRSMTGFGVAAREGHGRRVTVEIKSVNHRFLKTQIRLPLDLQLLEPEVESRLRARIGRGAVHVAIYQTSLTPDGTHRIDAVQARVLHSAIGRLFADLNPGAPAPEPLRLLEAVLRLPGVVVPRDDAATIGDELREMVLQALDAAIDSLVQSREVEGGRTAEELRHHGQIVARLRDEIAARSPEATREARDRFAARVNALLAEVKPGLTIDDALLLRESASAAERSDITEEINRLKAHLDLLRSLVADPGEVGRRLDFLLQEMLREANTIGSKASDLGISHRVVEVKAEIDKMKEQVQNLE